MARIFFFTELAFYAPIAHIAHFSPKRNPYDKAIAKDRQRQSGQLAAPRATAAYFGNWRTNACEETDRDRNR
jgi:hypothetical protein